MPLHPSCLTFISFVPSLYTLWFSLCTISALPLHPFCPAFAPFGMKGTKAWRLCPLFPAFAPCLLFLQSQPLHPSYHAYVPSLCTFIPCLCVLHTQPLHPSCPAFATFVPSLCGLSALPLHSAFSPNKVFLCQQYNWDQNLKGTKAGCKGCKRCKGYEGMLQRVWNVHRVQRQSKLGFCIKNNFDYTK